MSETQDLLALGLTREQVQKLQGSAVRRARAKRAADVARARIDPAFFVEFAFRHEATGKRLKNAAHHERWHDHLTAHDYAVIIAPVEHGKTVQIGIGRVIWELGNDPSLRAAIISDTAEQAEKLLRSIRTNIEENSAVHEVFPHLERSKREGDPWHSGAITVHRYTIAKDPSIQTCGAYGAINGSRLDLVVLDDVLDFDNTRTPDQRNKLVAWIESTVLTRLTGAAKLWAIGTPWHPEDLLHNLAQRPGFKRLQLGAVHNPDDPPATWKPLWPEQWPLERLLQRFRQMTEQNFLRKMLCRVRADIASRFKAVWIENMARLGKHRSFLQTAPKAQGGMRELPCFTGVDLGVGQTDADALSVIFTVAIDERGRRIVVDIQAGRWSAPEILDRLSWVHTRFGSHIFVESNGAQRFLVQMANGRFPVTGLTTTGANKHHQEFGVESLAVEMRAGWWVLPSGDTGSDLHPEGRAWCSELLHYDPAKHTGDRVMASWIAREGARRFGMPMVQQVDLQAR